MTDKFTRKETEKLPCRNNSSGGKSRFHQVSKLPCKTHISCGNLMNNFPSSMAVKMQRCARKKELHERAFPQSFGAAWFLATARKSSNTVSRHSVTQRVRLVSPHPCMHSWYVESVSERRFFACYASVSGPNESSLPRDSIITRYSLARLLEKAPPIKIT